MNGTSPDESPDSTTQRIDSFNGEQRVYFVPLRWWKDAQDSMPSESVEKKRDLVYSKLRVVLWRPNEVDK